MGDLSYWISGGALALSVVVALTGYMQKPTFVSAARAGELRAELASRDTRIAALEARVQFLENRCETLMQEREFWQRQYRALELRTHPGEPT